MAKPNPSSFSRCNMKSSIASALASGFMSATAAAPPRLAINAALSISIGSLLILGRGDIGQNGLSIGRGKLLRLHGMIHGTELGSAHGTEGGVFESLLGQRFVMIGASGVRVERK